jgi:sugar diacid utilization regulator/putative methionine-R-sulfoxide reductase with GAF domain
MRTSRARQFKSLLDRISEQSLLSDELVQAAVDLVARCMGTEVATLYAYDRRANELVLVATRGLARSAVGYLTLTPGQGMSGSVATEMRPRWTADVRTEPRFLPIRAFDQNRFLSMLAVPVVLDGYVAGVLNVQTLDVHQYHQREVQELLEIAELLAPMLDGQWRGDLAARLRGPSALSRLDGFLASRADPFKVGQRLAEELQRLFPDRRSSVALLRAGHGLSVVGDQPDEYARDLLNREVAACLGRHEPRQDERGGIVMALCDSDMPRGAFYIAMGEGVAGPLSSAANRLLESLAAQVASALARAEETDVTPRLTSEANSAYEDLIGAVLDDAGLDALIDRASRLCKAPIAVTDGLGMLVAGTMPDVVSANIPLRAGEAIMGRLISSRPAEAVPAMTAAAQAIAVELSKWKVRFDLERDLRGDALDSILSGQADQREAASRARLIGMDVEKPYVPVLFMLDVADLTRNRGEIVLRSLLTTMQRTFGQAPASVSFAREEGILVLAEEAALRHGAVQTVADALAEIRRSAPESSVSAGIGPAALGQEQYASAVRQARLAAELAARLDAHQPIAASQIGAYQLLAGIDDAKLLREFVAEHLGALIENDSKRGTEFIRTLEAFHACGEKLQPTAAALYVHLNTLKHRLARIQSVSGRSLDTPSNRFNMYLALYALRLLEPERSTLLPNALKAAEAREFRPVASPAH